MSNLEGHLNELKSSLLVLEHTGPSGFEGLIAAVMGDIIGVTFRLASSGRQDGIDGATTSTNETLVFECKHYKDKKNISRNDLVAKLSDFARQHSEIDAVWVLAATVEISTQIAKDLVADGEKIGVFVTLLDWSGNRPNRLATALAMANEITVNFLAHSARFNSDQINAVKDALSEIQQNSNFETAANDIRQELTVTSRAFELARQANREYLENALSCELLAKNIFGQSLTPKANNVTLQPRKTLIKHIIQAFMSPPDGNIRVVHGDEGCGKSWAVMQAWLRLENPPITLFVAAQTADSYASIVDKSDTLITLLIKQSGGDVQDIKRWVDRWGRMKSARNLSCPRLVVVLDGLNQRPTEEWPSMIERLASLLKEVGGVLIVTVRTAYYQASVRPCLKIGLNEVVVSEWTIRERNKILVSQDINLSELKSKVLKSLRNPRLLGISLELLDRNALAGLHELDVSRLLFEHIRTSASVIQGAPSPHEFAKELENHAKRVLKRIELQQPDDSRVFHEGGLPAVADGRFFRSLSNDPTHYELRDDGLTLALGIALVRELHKARRNNSPVSEAAAKMMEPIVALDESSSVILAGLNVLIVDDSQFDAEIVVCLLLEFARLQNIDHSYLSALKGLARLRVDVFLQAVEKIHFSAESLPNVDLLESTLREPLEKETRDVIDSWIRRWLKTYTRSADYGWAHIHQDSMDRPEAQSHRETEAQNIQSRRASLSTAEKEYLFSLHEHGGGVFALHETAFRLLAGCRLAPFASEMVSSGFSSILNAAHRQHHRLFLELCSFNTCDWSDMRKALLEESKWLYSSEISKVGWRTRAGVLISTGNPVDATKAFKIKDRLQDSSRQPTSFRRIETICETDPCDPSSAEPGNIQNAINELDEFLAADYATDSHTSKGLSMLDDVLLPLARHRSQLITGTMRGVIEDVVEHKGPALRTGLLQLIQHRALVTPEQAKIFVNYWLDSFVTDRFDEADDRRREILSQFYLLMGFHHFDGDYHLEVLASGPHNGACLLSLLDLCEPATEAALNRTFDATDWTSPDAARVRYILAFLAETNTTLSESQTNDIASLFDIDDANIALHTLLFATASGKKTILRRFLNSAWASRRKVKDCNNWSDWHSRAFIQASSLGLTNIDEVFDAILPEHLGLALRVLGMEAAEHVASLLRSYVDIQIPEIEEIENVMISRVRITDLRACYPFASFDDLLPENDWVSFSQHLNETQEEWKVRQERACNRGQKFLDEVRSAKFDVFLSDIDSRDIEILLKADGELGRALKDYLTDVQSNMHPIFRNFALALAYALAQRGDDDAAKSLLVNYHHSRSAIKLIDETTELPLEVCDAWRGPSTTFLELHRFERLDKAFTDHVIALEVLAAELGSNCETLHAYIRNRSNRPEPSFIARAIMVAGFMDENPTSTALLEKFENAKGFIGTATKAALFAYKRNSWARQWHEQMLNANDPEDFWCAQMLFEKIVDGRFYLWSEQMPAGPLAKRHQSLIQTRVKARCGKWREKRDAKLFGEPPPHKYMLESFAV